MLSACELILEGKAKPGDSVRLLWRETLLCQWSECTAMGDGGEALAGACVATRVAGGWELADTGGERGERARWAGSNHTGRHRWHTVGNHN